MSKPLCLLERVRASDSKGESLVTEVTLPIVYRWCRQWGVPQKDAPTVMKRIYKTLFEQFRAVSQVDETFLSFLWKHAKYHASEHPRVQSMGIPDRYPEDVPDSLVIDDENRLTHETAQLLIGKLPTDQHVVFKRLFDQGQTATQAAAHLPFTLSEIRRLRNGVLRRVRSEFTKVIEIQSSP